MPGDNIPYIAIKTLQLTKAEIENYQAQGYVVVDMQDSVSPCTHADGNEIMSYGVFEVASDGLRVYKGNDGYEKNIRYSNLFGGLRRCHSEILPLASTNIDVNIGLRGQQTPGY